jgi:hypothetical protein
MKALVELHSKLLLRKTMLVFRWKRNNKFSWLALKTKNENTTMAPRKAKKEQAALRKVALENMASSLV